LELKPQTELTLRIVDDPQQTHYISYVLGYSRIGLCVTIPRVLHQSYALPVGTRLTASYGVGGSLCEFDTLVLGYQRVQPVCMVLQPPSEIRQRDRRDSFRLKVRLPVSYVSEGPRAFGERTYTVNLSMGGLAMVTSRFLPVGAAVNLVLELPDQQLTLSGRVSWSEYRGTQRQSGIEFQNVPPRSQKILGRALFQLERQTRIG
jgi:c-di-GMP-binding flagellar brake protein YcgR